MSQMSDYIERIEALIVSMHKDIQKPNEDISMKRRHVLCYIEQLKKLRKDL